MGHARAIVVFAVTVFVALGFPAWMGGSAGALQASTHPSVISVTLSPQDVVGGQPATGTVWLSSSAPRGGLIVTVSSSNTSLASLTSSKITVSAGQSKTTFTIKTTAVNSAVSVTISATLRTTARASLTVAPPQINSLSLSSASLTGGQTSTGTVVLASAAAVGGATITLSSSSGAAYVPASVTVPGGSTTVSFNVTTQAVANPLAVTLGAGFSGSSKATTLTLEPPVVTALVFSPASVTAGQISTATVTLNAPAPGGGYPVALMSNSPAVPVPASVLIPAGATTQAFSVITTTVSSFLMAMVVATTGTTTATGILTVNPPTSLSVSSVGFAPTSITGGTVSTGTITLSSPAPSGGSGVSLTSSDTSVSVPGTVMVPAGSTTQTFSATALAVASTKAVTVAATLGASSASATLTVIPPVVSALSFTPATISFDQITTGTVTLNANAPTGGLTVNLSSNDPGAISVPASMVVPAGVTSQSFTATAGAVTSTTVVGVTVSNGSASVEGMLTVNPALMASPASVVFASDTLVGVPSTQTITLTNAAGASVTLTSIAASAEFTETNTCPAALAAGGSCVITLTPTQGGSLTGNSTILSSASNSALTVNLSGSAMHWVALDWTASSTPGATYFVYRQVQSGGVCATPGSTTYAKLNSSPIRTTTYNDTDPTLVPGNTYCYSVVAVDSGGTSAFTNPPASATLASP
jgi:hypothetical protein